VNALASYDLRPIPLRFHLNIGYYLDNSGNLQNYDAAKSSAVTATFQSLPMVFPEDRFPAGARRDAPFDELTQGFSLRPLIEYHFEYLTGSKDQVIYNLEHATCAQHRAPPLAQTNKDQQSLTLGYRHRLRTD